MFLLSVRVCRIPYELLAILILMGTMHETLQKREKATREPGRLSGDGMYRVHHCSGLYQRINRNKTPPGGIVQIAYARPFGRSKGAVAK